MNHIARVKVLTLGSSQVGKSCLVKRYCERRFVPKYLPTIGIDYGVTRLTVDNVEARVHIFDTSGRPLFAEVRCEFYSGMAAVLLVYDVTERASFDALAGWLAELGWAAAEPGQRPVLVVAANKTDLTPREIGSEEGERWAAGHGAQHFQVSASSGHGVQQLFTEFFQMAVRSAAAGRHRDGAPPPPAAPSSLNAWIRRIRTAPNDWDKLGLRPGYSKDDVNRAYKALAVMLHPDKNSSPEAAEAFKTITGVRNNLLKTFSAT
ncbi:dnaJ homolog subfamily C member 27-like [Pollicipes pollicipes]|uniref:dnaJ homolog subfamily C member 27-like n=1 Tax=Pollicipes pollicipes TaxID=41117 RepID=UPI001884F7CF|nr:dnaJ homolog subfamily C member 27-like [Pollicipes pollicipes]